jgi:hypothetical protein
MAIFFTAFTFAQVTTHRSAVRIKKTPPASPTDTLMAIDDTGLLKKTNFAVNQIGGGSSLILPSNQIAFGNGTGVISSGDFTWDNLNKRLNLNTDGSANDSAFLYVNGSMEFEFRNSDGTIRTNEEIFANGFVANGGLSSQFLKADGTIDSNLYLTDAPSDSNDYVRNNGAWVVSSSSGSGAIETQINGSTIDANATTINLTGPGVSSGVDSGGGVTTYTITGGSGGSGRSILNAFFLSDAPDFESAIDSVQTKTANEGKEYYLIVDTNVSITGTPRQITVDVPVFVQKGMVITTPDVSLPITGTINDNYIQIQFNETFIADKNSTVFDGDGLIWFGFSSIEKLYANWYGLVFDSQLEADQNKNVDALIKAGITVSQDRSDRATTIIHIGNGDLYLNSPVPFFATVDINDHPHLTGVRRTGTVVATVINVEGATPIKHGYRKGEQTNLIYTAKYGAVFMPQGMRNSSFRNLQFLGQNDFDSDETWKPAGYPFQPNYSELVLRNDNFEGGDVNEIHWIEDDINWARGRPYSAIITDAFRTGVGGGAYSLANEPTSKIDLYYTASVTPSDQNSWDVIVENIHAKYFVEFMTVGLKGQQNDTYVWRNIQVEKMPIGISIVQDQSRDCKVYEFMSYLDCWAMFDTTIHGSGIMPEVMSAHTAGGLKYIMHGFQSDGIVTLNNIYAEALYGIGTNFYNDDVFAVNGLPETDELPNRATFASSINNSTFKLIENDSFTYADGTGYWVRPPTLKGFRINNTSIGVYTFGVEPNFRYQTFQDVELNGVAIGTTVNDIQPVDAGYFKTTQRTTISDASNWKTVDWSHTSTFPANDISENNVGQYVPDLISDNVSIPLKYNKGSLVENIKIDRCDITGYNRLKASFTISNFDGQLFVGDFLRLNRSNFNIQGTVRVDNGDGSFIISSLNTADLDLLDAQTTAGDRLNYFDLFLVRHRDADKPFLAVKGANNKELVLQKYAQYGSPQSDGQDIEIYDKYVFPDMIERTVVEIKNDTIVFAENYTQNDTIWLKPIRPNIKTINFIEPNNTTFGISGFFEKGKRYNYYLRQYSPILIATTNLNTGNKALCVKSGDFFGNIKGSIESDNKASFLIISPENKILSYLNGASYNTTDGVDNKILLNRSGTTAERPDNFGFPTEYLPDGFVYVNTEIGQNEVWNGVEFVPTKYLGQFTVATLPSGNQGDEAIVTDGASVGYRATATGGGTEFVPVLFDGTNWIYN